MLEKMLAYNVQMPTKDKEDELDYFSASRELLHVFRHDQNLDCS